MSQPAPRKPLRLWPGVVALVLLIVLRYVVPIVAPEAFFIGLLGGVISAAAILVWWLFFSRAPWSERLGAIVLMVVGVMAAARIVHVSIRTGMMGNMLPAYSIFVLPPALVLWAVATRRLSPTARRIALVATIAIACGSFALVRTDGIIGGSSQLTWRWTKTAEERLLAREPLEPERPAVPVATPTPPAPAPSAPATAEATPPSVKPTPAPAAPPPAVAHDAEWPGFRGALRDGVIRNVEIETDWTKSPPVELWRRAVGPAWSSFAVDGDLIYTQEQRGDDELVACYRRSTGQPVWRHRDKVRFWESNGGAGPRGTPTLSNGRVYAFGATGILNALDAATGALIWSKNAAADTGKAIPMWGFSSSPLVENGEVIVATAGTLAAYDLATGRRRWIGPVRGSSYSSPHLATIDGVRQILLLAPPGIMSVNPADGTLLWEHTFDGGAIVQPAFAENGDVLINAISATGGQGLRRLAIAHGLGGWTAEERWTSTGSQTVIQRFRRAQGLRVRLRRAASCRA